MSIDPTLHWLQDTALGLLLRGADPLLIEVTQIFHVLGLLLVLASAFLLGMRLLGFVLTDLPAARLAKALRPIFAIGVVVTAGSGLAMFLSATALYAHNAAFGPKLALLIAALTVQVELLQSIEPEAAPSRLARGGAALSLLLWFSVAAAGRAIGYV